MTTKNKTKHTVCIRHRKKRAGWASACDLADIYLAEMTLFCLSGHQPCMHAADRGLPRLTLLQEPLCSLFHIHERGVRTQAHTHQHARRRPIRQRLAHSAFLLPTDWRTEAEGGPRPSRVARQNGWSHEHRSVYKPEAERSSAGGVGREEAVCRLTLKTIMDRERTRRSVP